MNAITVSREYGAGGGEVARRLAELFDWRLLDRELLHEAAAIEHVPDAELERMDEQAIRLVDRLSFHPPHRRYMHGLREAVLHAAADGNVVLVGRGNRQILGEMPDVFHVRLVAPLEWRAHRMARLEGWPIEQARARCQEVDRTRERFNGYFFGASVRALDPYDLTVDTSRFPLDEVVELVRAVVRNQWPDSSSSTVGHRVLTVARELGAGETNFSKALGERLELDVHDRDLLEQEAVRLGVTEAELETVDEELESIQRQWQTGSLAQRYHEALSQRMRNLAGTADVLLVGRGGCRFLRDLPHVLHLRLVAPPEVRLRRVMEHLWQKEPAARKLLVESDVRRRKFYQAFFGADWTDPLEYHLTINTGRLGTQAVDLAALAATRFWGHR